MLSHFRPKNNKRKTKAKIIESETSIDDDGIDDQPTKSTKRSRSFKCFYSLV